jgi:hypothetical protein
MYVQQDRFREQARSHRGMHSKYGSGDATIRLARESSTFNNNPGAYSL